jgi:acyl-CoA thioesterase YciA
VAEGFNCKRSDAQSRICGHDSAAARAAAIEQLFKESALSKSHQGAGAAPTALPVDRMPDLRLMPMPADANVHGDVFGGWIMAQVDIAGSLPAVKRANGRVATIAVNSFLFKQPVFVGDLLSFYADVVKVGTTSVTVQVEVYAERQRLNAEVVKVTEATLTYVATDEFRKPRPLPVLPTPP